MTLPIRLATLLALTLVGASGPIPAAERPSMIIAQVKTKPLCLWSRPPFATESAMVPETMLVNPAA